MLTPEQRDHYLRDGFLVIPHFKRLDEIAALRRRAEEIVDAFDPNEVQLNARAIFTTRDQARARDAWFLGSDNTVRRLFKEEAFGEDASGLTDGKPKHLAPGG